MTSHDSGQHRQDDQVASVMVIDDNPAEAETIGRYIARHGFQVRVESNVFAGINLARRIKPTIVFLDIQMPGIGGVEAASLVAGYLPGAKVILMSGYPEQLSHASRESVHAFAILEKPLPLPAIVDFVRRSVG